ncbi:MAG: hemerythrin domain-containing protein [Candidatus Eisenbacteria bacterium]|uniref:Hemerythrin domain-containing protein n=1 Tax=Eiseniibacteriota bacterium TaxID=2212470 RepID=A0A538T8Z3_UNCEI|nr:MAG: hemerythrin domain-containing protein [Candidatus Eisenbacteria bacterium]
MTIGQPSPRSTDALRAEHQKILASLYASAERLERLHEQTTPQQMAMAREVLDFVRQQVAPHSRAEEYTLYPAADWAAGEGSHVTEMSRFEHQLVTRRCEALDKAIQAGAPAGKLMHLCYAILGLIAAHFVATEEVLFPYLDKAFDPARFEKEVVTPLRVERGQKR